MRHFRLFFVIFALCAPSGVSANVNCSIFEAIERLQFARARLSLIEGARFGSADALFLIQEAERLDADQVAFAHDGALSSFDTAFVSSYIRSAQRLAKKLSIKDNPSTSVFFTEASFKLAQDRMARLLSRLNCNPLSRSGTSAGTRRILSSLKQTAPARKINFSNVSSIFVGAIALSILGFRGYGMLKVWRGRKRRQSKRFHMHLDTQINSHNLVRQGTVLDLSCNGAKIQLDTNAQDSVGNHIDVMIDNTWNPAKISWFNTHYIGLKFDNPLRHALVQTLRKPVK